ncbi:MAG: hypothetical protein WBF77_13485 [Sulfurimonadaceae bacterium]
MQIRYVGPKTLISTRGISFENKKKDKFIYLESLLHLIQAIDHDYVGDKIYMYMAESRQLKSDDLINRVKQYCPDTETIITEAKKDAVAYIDDKLMRAGNSKFLNDEEIRVFINNITLMRDYTIQRHINKSIYYNLVKKFIERLRHNRIAHISAPAHKTYFHVFHTIQRSLRQQKAPVNSQVTFHKEGNNPFIKLHVINF